MKNVKSTKTLASFSGSSMNLSDMKKVQGGVARCYRPAHGNGGLDICPDHQ